MPRKDDRPIAGHPQMVMTPDGRIRAGVYIRQRHNTVWRRFASVAEATSWQATARAAQDDPNCPPIPLVDTPEPTTRRERHSIADALDLVMEEYRETGVGGGTARGQKHRRRSNCRSGDPKDAVTIRNMERYVRRLRDGLGQVGCDVLDDDQVRRGLIKLSNQYGLDAITLTTYEGVMYAALKKAIAKGWRDRANPLEAPVNIVVEHPLPRRGRIRPGTIVESVHRLLQANLGVWYSVAEIIPLVGLLHADGRPMARREAQAAITAALWQLLFGEATGIRCAPRMLEPAPDGPHRTHLCVRVWTYGPSLPCPAPEPGALDGEAVTMIGSLRASCALPWADRMVACTQRLVGTRIGETLACHISDYVPGDRSAGRRGLLHLYRNPKPRTNSVRWVVLPWEIDSLYQYDLTRRYGDAWRTDPQIRDQQLFAITSSTRYWLHWSEAYYAHGLLHRADGTTRRPHHQRGDFLTDMWAWPDTSMRADAAEYAGQDRPYPRSEEPASVAEQVYVMIGSRHEIARTRRGERVAGVADTFLGDALSSLAARSLVELFVVHDRQVEHRWMGRDEAKAIAQALGMTTYEVVAASGATVEPGPLTWGEGSGRPIAYEREPIETWVKSLHELAAPPPGMITFPDGAMKYEVKLDALRMFARNRGWPIEEHPITGMQMVEEGRVQDYSREHQLPPGCISTKEAGDILGVSAERAAVLAHKHGWIVARYEWGKRTALDPALVRAYAEQTGRIPPGSPLL